MAFASLNFSCGGYILFECQVFTGSMKKDAKKLADIFLSVEDAKWFFVTSEKKDKIIKGVRASLLKSESLCDGAKRLLETE